MLKEALIGSTGPISDNQFKLALDMATLDIKANRYMFNKRTSLREAVRISGMCLHVLQTRILYTD